jgi:pyruvate,water dikinase
VARLAAAGLPVPEGFHVTTAAYCRFVAENQLQDQIVAAAAEVSVGSPATLAQAARQIEALFARAEMPAEVAEAILQAYAALGAGELAVAVRSSATAEDLPEMSFAGQQETYLNIRGAASVLAAIQRCWASLWTARAIGYRARHGIAPADVSLAVVVQELVPAEAAGVLFTANPLTGARDQVLINAAWGLGEAIVGGQVTPDTLVIDKATAAVAEQQISRKDLMTVRTAEGTREQPVPAELRDRAVLGMAQAAELANIGVRIEQLYGQPMDIEWALHDGRMFIVQARPITTLREPLAEEWNDSLRGDYLWSNANLGEAIPDVMTPCTWSLVQIFMADAMATTSVDPYRGYGNIGGRFYMNLSVAASLAAVFGYRGKRFVETIEPVFGKLPVGVTIPLIPLSRWRVIRMLLPVAIRVVRRVRANKRRLSAFVAAAPECCQLLRARIQAIADAAELAELWRAEIEPYFHECNLMLEAAGRQDAGALVFVRRDLQQLVGEADANALTSGLHTGASQLASLGPLIGLAQLARGAIDRASYARKYGHRGPHEFEISIARPAEDPGWVDQQLAGLRAAPVDVSALLARQREAQAAAWARFERLYPRKVATMRRRIDGWAAIARAREATRSEVIRLFWVLREFVLRSGVLTGQGDDLFFLRIEEILELLAGDQAPLAHVEARRAAYARYSALPPYPALIRGRFDPFRWAADPQRRSDLFDASGTAGSSSMAIRGFPGAEGLVEGRARVIATVEQGDQLQAGEILVTTVTNIGWTPLFPRAAAVVTDVGAPLSHAAIVARELGIPAVVGCGNATMRLHTGDRVRVDGGQGTVEVLSTAVRS